MGTGGRGGVGAPGGSSRGDRLCWSLRSGALPAGPQAGLRPLQTPTSGDRGAEIRALGTGRLALCLLVPYVPDGTLGAFV